ncbi:MAG: T9SS type A sorting domain-containing protein [Saprospiraceae bacterium]
MKKLFIFLLFNAFLNPVAFSKNAFLQGFTVEINCNAGNLSATATSNDPTGSNPRWELWATSVEGATSGGTLISTIHGGVNATFYWLDMSRFHYIRYIRTINGVETQTAAVVPDFSGNANAAYSLEDASGTEKNTFCFGEDIYFDGTASSNYDRFFLAVWRRPVGSVGPFTYYANYGWTFTNNIGIRNLSQMFLTSGENPGEVFEPGFEYQLQFAISNVPNCVPWVESLRTFTVTCCGNYLKADFKEELIDDDGGTSFSVNVSDFLTYGPNTIHEWVIFSSPNWTDGPYTLVHETTTTGAGPIQLYDQGEIGLYYFIVHRLVTACGMVCYSQFVENTVLDFPFPGLGDICELCGPIDCALIDGLCVAPDDEYIYCHLFPSNGVFFNWDPAQNATQYRVEININDPSCCGSGLQNTLIYNTNATYLSLSGNMAHSCFSWRVGALCNGEVEPIWSEYHCFSGCEAPDDKSVTTAAGLTRPAAGSIASKILVEPQIYPNPANDELNIALPLDAKAGLIKVIDLQGKVVFEHRNPEQHLNIDSSKFIAGMYAIQIIYSDGSQSVEQIVITH